MIFVVAHLLVRYDDADHTPIMRICMSTVVSRSREAAVAHSAHQHADRHPDMQLVQSEVIQPLAGLLSGTLRHCLRRWLLS